MSKVLRIVTMWLVLLAIPLQGVAAVVMPLCTPVDTMVAVEAAPSGDACTGHAHRHHGCASDTHHHLATATDALAEGPADLEAESASQHGHASIKCCSLAGSLAAAYPAVLAGWVPPQSAAPVPEVEQIFAGVILDGLDRPPRRFLA